MGLGTLYVLYFLGDEVFNHAALAKAENGVVGWVPLSIMWTGVVNCISCLPMSKFSKGACIVDIDDGGAVPHIINFHSSIPQYQTNPTLQAPPAGTTPRARGSRAWASA